MGLFLSAPHLAQAAPTTGTTTFPVSGGFTTINQSSGGSRISLNFSGFTFMGVSTGNIAISQASSAVNLLVTPTGATPVYLGFASDDGSNFKLSSFTFRATNATYATTLTLTGYSNGSAVSGATSTLAVTSFGVGNNFTFDVSAITAFQNIDEVRITGPTTGTGGVALLSITIQTAVTPAVAPTVTTPTSASIAATTATLGGNVTSDGGAAITERGVVFSLTATNGNPLINGSGVVKTTTTGTTGVFTVPVSSLTANSGYSYKAYATNSVNTSYSPVSTFTTLAQAPTVTSLATTSGPTAGGTSVVITGTNLTAASAVQFGATNAASFTVNSATQITAVSPAGSAGTVDVTVTTAGGTSAINAGDQFTYVAAPTVTSLATTSGPTAGGTSVVITGTNLTAASAVKFGATNAASFTVNSATQITAVSPAGSAGTVDVTVTTAGGTSAINAGDQFTFVAAPTVTSLATTSGPTAGGTSVVITGTNLTAASAVKFGATNAASFTVNSATQITAVSPAGSAGTVDVTVTTVGGTSATGPGDQFTYVAVPTVTSLATTSGPAAGGTSVVITGTNLTAASAVKFGATNAASFTVNSATQITAVSPAGSAGTVDVTVTTAGGTSATTPGDQFTYVAAPTVTSLATTSGPAAGGTSVVITGTNFTGVTAVKFGATNAASFTFNSATQITAVSPAGSAGTVDVTVTTPGGTSATTPGDQFTFVALPTVTSLATTSGPTAGGTSVVITGTNLTAASAVKFGATNAASFTVNSATQITAVSPAGSAGTVNITVTTVGGTSATGPGDQFTYVAAPTVTSLATTSGPAAGGTSVVITGTNLTAASAVKFGATNATSFTVNSATQITAVSPAGSAGTVDVTVTTAGGTSATTPGDQFTYVAAPTVTSLATTSGPAAGGTSVVITGTNLTAASAVKFGATNAASFTVNSATQITAVSPAGSAGTVNVTVTTAGGTSATGPGDQFTYVAAPTVTSLATTSGPTAGGTSVVITGTNLTAASAVKFGATNAASFTVNSATQITAVSPAGSAGTVDVTVTTAGGTSATTPGDQFTFVGVPTVASLSPASGLPAGGTSVIITGTNFTGVTAVKFGAVNAASFTFNSATQITATSPAGTGTVDVTVTTPGGTSATNPGDQFTYASNPTITSLSPATGPAAGGTTVTITGTNLTGATSVTFGGTPATLGANTGTTLIVTTPAHAIGPVSVIVTTPGGANAANTAFAYVEVPVVLAVDGTLTVDGTTSTNGLATSVKKVGSNLVITDPNNVLGYGPAPTFTPLHTISIPFASVTTLTLTGGGENDYFTLDFSTGLPPTINIFGGGETGPPGDGMSIVSDDGSFVGDYRATGLGDGNWDVTSNTTSITSTVNFYGLEPIDATGIVFTDATIDINHHASTPGNLVTTVAADAVPTNTNVSFTLGLEGVVYGSITGSLTITGDATDNDRIVLVGLGTAMQGHFNVDGNGGAGDIIECYNTTFTVPGAGKNLSLKADFIGIGDTLAAAPTAPGVLVCSGNITLEANGDTTLGGSYLWNPTTGVWGDTPSVPWLSTSFMTPGTIQLRGAINKTSGGDTTLTLKATGDVATDSSTLSGTLYGGSITNSSVSGKLNVVLNSDSDGANGGRVSLSGGSITTLGGDFTIGGGATPASTFANASATTASIGVSISAMNINTGGGNVSILGQCTTGNNIGVNITCVGGVSNGSSIIDSGAGNINLTGLGGTGSSTTHGVRLIGSIVLTPPVVAQLKSSTGNITVTGTSQGTGGQGVFLNRSASITTTGTGNITVTGTGTGTPGANAGLGIILTPIASTTSAITSAGGNVTLIADKMNLFGAAVGTINVSAPSGGVTLKPLTAAVAVNLGSPVDTTASTLELSTSELGRVTTPTLTIGSATSGVINVSQLITPTTYTTLALANNSTIAATGGFTSTISSATNFNNITVTGTLGINTNASLSFVSGGGFVPTLGQFFRIITNDSSDAIVGNFSGLAEGATLTNFLTSGINEGITYAGGTGNDLVIGVAPTVSSSTAPVLINSTTLIITGTGFDSTTPSNNLVTLSNGATGVVTAATSTQLTVTLSTPAIGSLTAVVNTGISSGAPVQVATVVPVITPSSANLAANAASVSINGFGFDPNPINDGVTFSGATTGTRTPTAASATGMSVSLPSPLIAGALNASMTSNGVSSGTAVQVATITPVVTTSTASLAANATTVTISGAGFDPTALNNTVTFNNGAVGTVTSASNTSLTVTFSANPASAGPLTAIVTTNSVSSGSAVQVATVTPVITSSTANITTTASTLTINGFGFDSSNVNNSVTLNLGATGTVTTSSPTQIVVTFGVAPTAGSLTAVVTSNSQSSGAAVQVATVVNLSITSSTASLAQNATQLIINGTGFSTTPANNSVSLSSGTATVTAATATQLTCTLGGSPSLGALNATVTVTGTGTTGPTQVATIVAAPTVTLATTSLPINSTTVTIAGTGFDSSSPGNNTVVFNNGATGTVTSATATSLGVTFSAQPAAVGSLTAVVTSFGGSSGTARQVATVAPVVTSATTNLAANATTVTINGFGFDSTAVNNVVTFNNSATGTVSAASSTSLTVTFGTKPASAGSLTASVTTNSVSSGSAVQVATVIPVITASTTSIQTTDNTVTINGFGFGSSNVNNSVSFNLGATGTVTTSSPTQLVVTFGVKPTVGNLTAVVSSNTQSSGSAVQVATVSSLTITSSTANLVQSSTTLDIAGTGFSTTAGNNTVTFNNGAVGTVTSATSTLLTVTFSTRATSLGALNATVSVSGVGSSGPTQVATVIAGAAAKLAVITQPTNTASGTAISPSVTVQIQDANGFLTTSTSSVTMAIGTNPSSGTLSGTVTVAAVAGTATFSTLSIDKVGTGYTLSASSGVLTSATSDTFNITPGAPAKLVVGTQPTNAVSSTAISPAVTVQIQDAAGNLTTSTANVVMAIGTNPSSGTLSGTVTVAAVAGTATFSTLNIDKAGTGYTLSATSGVLTSATTNTFNITAGAPAKLAVTTQPTNTVSTTAISPAVVVQIQDAAGNLTSSTANVVMAIGTNPGSGTLSGTATVAAVAGSATFSTLSIDKVGTGYTLSATSGVLTSATSNAFNITVGAPAKLAVTTQPTNTVSATAISPAVTVQIQDAGGNLTSSTANVVMAIGTNPSSGTLSGTTTVAAVAGTATFSTLNIDKAGTGYTLGATSGVLTSATSNTFNITAGAPAKLAVTTQPTNTVSATAISPSVVVQIQDAAGNLTTSTANVVMAIGTNPSSGTLSGTATVAAVAGSATFSTLNIDKAGTGYTLSATSGVLTSATSNTFNITPGLPAKLAVTTQPTNTVSDVAISPSVVVQIQDAAGNLTSSTANVVMAIGSNPSSGTLSGTTTVAAVAGSATFSTLNIDRAGTGYTLSASSGLLTSATSNTFNITAGVAAKLAVSVQPTNTVSGTAISPAVTVQIQDSAGNLTTSTANVTMAIGTNPSSGTLSGTATVAAVAGTATFSNLSIDKAGTGYTLGAVSGILTPATSSSFNITAGAPAKLAVITQPTNAVSATTISPSVTVQIQDAAGNLTTSTANVAMSIGTNPSSGTLSGTTTVAAVAGTATFSTLSIDKAGTGYTLSAVSGILTPATSSAFNITAGAPAKLAVIAQPTSAVSATAISPAVTVQIQDAAGNLTTSTANVAMSIGTNPGSGTLSGTTTVAAVAGTATFSTLSINKAGTGYTLSAVSGILTPATSNTFNITAGAPAKLAVGTQPTDAVSATSISPAVTIRILDAADNLTTSTASVTMAIGTNPSSGTLSGTVTVAAVAGTATFSTLNIDKAGTGYTLSATSGVLTSTTSSAFNITAGAPAKLAVNVQPTNAVSATAISPSVTVQIQDAAGNLTTSTANVAMSIGTNPSSGTLSGTTSVAAVAGTATFSTLNIDKAGTGYTLSATSGVLTSTTTNTFNITAGAPAKLAVIAQPSTTVAGVAISPAVTVQIQDAAGNLTTSTAGVTMAIGTNPGSSTLSGTLTVNAVAGTATFSTLSLNKTGTGYTLGATSGALTPATSGTFAITPAAAASLALSAPGTAAAGTPVSVSVTALDAFGNTATGYSGTVQFTSTDANAVLPSNSTLTSGAGNFNVTFQNAGSQTVTGTDTVASAITGTSGSIVVSEAITLTASDTTAAVTGGDTGTYLFTRGGNGAAVTVNFALNGASTASSGEFTLSGGSVSFNGSTGSLTIPSSSTSVTLTLTATANATGVAKPSKTVRLDLASGTGYISGAPTTGTVTIAQNGFLVTTVADSGQGSLRQAVLNANAITGADTITFSDGTGGTVNFTDGTPDTIALSSGQISLSSDLTISGPGPKLLTVQNSAALSGTSRVFIVPTGTAKTVQLIGLTMTGGNCTASGGGLLIDSGSNASVLVIVSAISDNSTTQFGGGINQLSGNLTVVSSTISNNTAAASGSSGGIDATGNSLTLINSTVSGNSITSNAPANGAGIWTNVTTATILNSTITNNTAAGGISGVYRDGGTLTVANSIIAGNVNNTTLPDVGGAFTSGGGNLIGNVGTATGFTATNDLTGTGASPRDPLLGALADNGGHTLTHALLNGSRAINNGLTGNLPADTFDLDGNLNNTEALPVDQRGGVNLRQRGPAPDSGSFEAFAFEPTITASTTDEDIQSSSGLVITANTADGGLTTHYQITSILNGTLFKNNGTTEITAGSFITKAEGSAGLKFTPSLNLNSPNTAAGFGFTAQAAIGTTAPADLRGATVPVAITVNSINDLPTVVGTGLADVRMTIGDVLVIPLGANFEDVDLDTLTFTVSGNTVPAKASASITGTTNVTVTGLAYGITNITIQADDGLMGTVTDTFEVAVGTENPTSPGLTGPVDPVTGLSLPPGSAYRFSNQTGGFEIDVPVQNTTAFAINGFRLHVDFSAYLAPNPDPLLSQPTLRLYNSTNNTRAPNPAVPAYIDYPYPVAVGETVRIRLNFYTQTRRFPNPFVPVLTTTKLTTSQTGGPLPPELTFTPARIRLNNAGQVLLEWTSTPALWYRIYYSDNMTTWFPSVTPIEATTNQMQWRDTGPPFTQSAPGASRFYMVAPIAAPAP